MPARQPVPARQPKQGEPPQVRMKVTERQRELMVDYLAFLRQSVHFSQSWARWKRIHNALMRSATYDYRLFRIEAELWEELQEDMEVLRQHRAGKQYVEGRN